MRVKLKNVGQWLAMFCLLALVACGGPRSIDLGDGGRVEDIRLAPDGQAFLAITSGAMELRNWPEGDLRWRQVGRGYECGPVSTAFSPDGEEIVVGREGRLFFYTAHAGVLTGEISLGEGVECVPYLTYRPDGRLALLVARGGEVFVEVWSRQGEPAGEPVQLPIPTGSLHGQWHPFTPDGRRMAYVREAYILGIMDVDKGERREWDLTDRLHGAEHPDELSIWGMAWSPNGREIAVGLTRRPNNTLLEPPLVMRIDAETGEVLKKLPAPENMDFGDGGISLTRVTYGPAGHALAAALSSPSGLFLYRPDETEPVVLCDGEDEACCVDRPQFAPDGATLATVCREQMSMFLWDLPNVEE